MNQKPFGQTVDTYHEIMKKAMGSRDKKIVREITKLEKEHEQKLDKLQKEAEKTIDPELRQEWMQAKKEYSAYMDKILIELDN